jgi:hypothetical protein
MRPETEGKIIVALIISLIAFGCGSGVGIVIGISQNDTNSPFSLNYTQPNNLDFPTTTTKSTDLSNTSSSQDSKSSDSEVVYVSKSGSSNNGNSKGNTSNGNINNSNTNSGY